MTPPMAPPWEIRYPRPRPAAIPANGPSQRLPVAGGCTAGFAVGAACCCCGAILGGGVTERCMPMLRPPPKRAASATGVYRAPTKVPAIKSAKKVFIRRILLYLLRNARELHAQYARTAALGYPACFP